MTVGPDSYSCSMQTNLDRINPFNTFVKAPKILNITAFVEAAELLISFLGKPFVEMIKET